MPPRLPDSVRSLAAQAVRAARRLAAAGDAALDERRLARMLATPAGRRIVFALVARRLGPVAAEGTSATILVELLAPPRPAASWTLALDGRSARAHRRPAPAPQLTVRVAAPDLAALIAGRLEPAQAMLDGRLDVRGDYALLMRLARSLRSGGVARGHAV